MDLSSVWMKGYHIMPAWGVHDESQAAEVIFPSSTPCLTCFSVSLYCGGFSVFFLCESDVRFCGRLCQFLFLGPGGVGVG